MTPIKSYRDLRVWQRAIELVIQIDRVTRSLPDDEKFGLVTQLRRAAVSIPANIAEGHGRAYRGDYLRFLSFARGSLMELETHIEIVVRLVYLPPDQVESLFQDTNVIGRMLSGLLTRLRPGAGL